MAGVQGLVASGRLSLVNVPPAAGAVVLIADDHRANRALVERCLSLDGHTVVHATDGLDGLAQFRRVHPSVVLADVVMPSLDGYELCRAIKSAPEGYRTPVVLVTSLDGRAERIRGIEAGADDFIVKPFHPEELRARVRSLIRLKRSTDALDSAEAVILSLARTIEARDPYTSGHCDRLAAHAVRLGQRLDLPSGDVDLLARGAVLHDIGKVGIPDAVLLKTGRLTRAEFLQMQQHTVIGDRICSDLRFLQPVRPIVRHHHERLDGSGYPDGLEGAQVPLLAQIVGIVDVYDALTTTRPYRQSLGRDAALEVLFEEGRCGWRDPELVAVFADIVCGRASASTRRDIC